MPVPKTAVIINNQCQYECQIAKKIRIFLGEFDWYSAEADHFVYETGLGQNLGCGGLSSTFLPITSFLG
jgi:hypothetical protein